MAARRLSQAETRGLTALLAALPDGECLAQPSPICDPCLVQHLRVGDRTYYIDPCVPEPCPGFQRAAARLVTFIDNLAAATPQSDAADCYSPSQNPTRGFEAGARGCACDWEGQGVCVSGNALVCETSATGDVARWHAVIDGPCWQQGSCSLATAVGTLELCLRDQPLCVGPIEGQFCR